MSSAVSYPITLLCSEYHWSPASVLCPGQVLRAGRVNSLLCNSLFNCAFTFHPFVVLTKCCDSTNQDGLIAFPEFLRMLIAPSASARLERLDELSNTVESVTSLFVLLTSLEAPQCDGHLSEGYDGFYDNFSYTWRTFSNFCTLNSEDWNPGSLKRMYCSLHTQVPIHCG